MTKQSIKNKLVNALTKRAKFKLWIIEFEGPALLIYPAELILIGVIVAVVIIAIKRPELIVEIIGAITG